MGVSGVRNRGCHHGCVTHTDAGGAVLLAPREVPLGGTRAMSVRRTLPHRDIRTIGAWSSSTTTARSR